ncbi:MAG: MFS transporter, partial [Candidatus Woesearchaeota archaeon]|nr:MFS transporter [Candidatus Woesearchaeota archaeon]
MWNMYVASFFVGFTFVTPIWILFFQLRGLSLAEIGFTATGTYLVNFLLEYPAGIYADRYGRKKACIVGTTL